MGQNYKYVNQTRKEYFNIGKFFEELLDHTNKIGYLLSLADDNSSSDPPRAILKIKNGYLGRWAGNEVFMVGEYNKELPAKFIDENYKNIGPALNREIKRCLKLKRIDAEIT